MFSRRDLLLSSAAFWLLPSASLAGGADDRLAALERASGGRLGVLVLNADGVRRLGHRDDERFAMCSTMKVLVAGHVLAQRDAGLVSLDRRFRIRKRDLIQNSSITEAHLRAPMSLAELCHATVTTSDNTAVNLILGATGGPEAVTAFVRSLGDTVTRLDRLEPEVNLVDLDRGDHRDTTTPASMASLVRTLVFGEALSLESREVLVGWLRASVTGATRLRAAWPESWRTGDKTGTGPDGPTNDVAVAWPEARPPFVAAAYYDRAGRTMDENAAVLAEVGKIIAE